METFLILLETYKYFIILPISIVEGPIITILAAFLVSQGFLNGYVVYAICLMGDMVGDVLHYALGRFGRDRMIIEYGKYIGVTEERVKAAENKYGKHLWKTIVIGKITHALNSVVLVAAGLMKADFRKFILITTVTNIPKVLFFFLVGYYFGESYKMIAAYIDSTTKIIFVVSVFVIIVGVMFTKNKKK